MREYSLAGRETDQSIPTRNVVDIIRSALLSIAFISLCALCLRQYRANKSYSDHPAAYLHLRSLDGYRSGTPVFISDYLSNYRPKNYFVVPVHNQDLEHQIAIWSRNAFGREMVFPILVCIDEICPLTNSERANNAGVVVLDRLQYIPAYAVAEAANQKDLLLLSPTFTVLEALPIPGNRNEADKIMKVAGALK